MKIPVAILTAMLFALATQACIWDAETLSTEKARSHDLATVILGNLPAPEAPQKLQERIKDIEANHDENNPDWWNNLAGAYLRLGQPAQAAKLLEPVIVKFPNDYGLHANLGTAYHLLGRYQDAEKEIARDLEINPDAHFGLEKYHLALLQYLIRDSKYQSRHVYVDEFTTAFLSTTRGPFYFSDGEEQQFKDMAKSYTNGIAEAEADYESLKTTSDQYAAMQILATVAVADVPQAYREKWNLAADTNFEAGVIYMAQMNPKESACFEMLGVAAWRKHNYNLAIAAFGKAISLSSIQTEILKHKTEVIQNYIKESAKSRNGMRVGLGFGLFAVVSIVILFCLLVRTLIRLANRRRNI